MAKKQTIDNDINLMIFKIIDEISNFRKIEKTVVEDIFKEAIIKTFHKKIDADAEIEVEIDEESKTFNIFNKNAIVVSDEEYEEQDDLLNNVLVGLTEAKKIDANLEEGDVFEKTFTLKSLPSHLHIIISQTFKQKIIEVMRKSLYQRYLPKKGTIVKAKFISNSKKGYVFELEDGAIAFMPFSLANKALNLQMNKVIDVYIDNVILDTRESQIILSNSSNLLLQNALERSIPEIASGEIEIVKISRIPGVRSKIAVRLNPEYQESGIEEVGSIIGKEGKRIIAIQNELEGERIDIVKYSDDIYEFITEAMSPAKVVSINYDNFKKGKETYLVVVPDAQNTIAIGKKGNNALLAVEITNTRLDIISVSTAKEKGVELLWNGNLTEEELEKIEAGEKAIYRPKRGNDFSAQRFARKTPSYTSSFDMSEFDQEIADYKISIEELENFGEEQALEESPEEINVNQILEQHLEEEARLAAEDDYEPEEANEEEQQQILNVKKDLKNFKYDNELASYAGLNDLDIEDEDWD
ncbi:transcription termination/antitermination protein NusA [Mycoplasma iguanae]|uniref:Transcription termination/antitermination protein NusA n=1 Tax=Mycoplasma iguanae TaxID=292461 RepID=A0ABY5R8P2_9MOLU|nr:transcription termination/antitermination protein NusA [Mycoplasma iguanae]UVD81809.1 transcription termination/antitermination protein NusA [Mycoplasma iguanae]